VLDRWMARTWFLSLWCTVAAFGTYACMYAFRKPFTAGRYVDPPFGEGLKTWFVLAQVLGYTLSKFVGIRVISEMPPQRRSLALLALISAALFATIRLRYDEAVYYGLACRELRAEPPVLVFQSSSPLPALL
jgi:hypothetical protein